MKNLVFITFLLLTLSGWAQNFANKDHFLIDSLVLEELSASDKQLIDSCIINYHREKEDSNKFKAVISIVEECWDDKVWPKYNDWIFKQTTKKLAHNPDIPTELFLKAALASSINNIGFLLYNQGDIPSALVNFHKALKIQEAIIDDVGMAYSFNNIGSIYNQQGDVQKAIEYYQKSLEVYQKLDDQNGIAKSLNYIGFIYYKLEDYPNALDNFERSLKISKETGDDDEVAISLTNLGLIHKNQKEYEQAIGNFKDALSIYEKSGKKGSISYCLGLIGSSESAKGNLKIAEIYGNKSLNIAKELGSPIDIKLSAEVLSKIYEKQNKGMKALAMHKLFMQMKDSVNNRDTQRKSALQQAKYEYEKQKVIDDAGHDKLIAIEQEKRGKQKIIITAITFGLVLVICFLIFVYYRLKITKSQKIIIEEQKEEVELAHYELEEKNNEILDSISYAKRIQSAILPSDSVINEYLKESFVLYKPKDIVAGDFYWIENVEDKVLFASADCTGHGVPGALVSVVCNNALNRSVREYGLIDPGKILDKTREIVITEFEKSDEEVKDGMDIALCSLQGNKLTYAGAHNPLWILRDGEILETKANKQPIGRFDKNEAYTTHSFDLEPGDTIYIFSDGYVDQFGGENGKKFKAKAFKELLLRIQNKSMDKQKTILNNSFETWRGSLEQLDDVCVIGVRIPQKTTTHAGDFTCGIDRSKNDCGDASEY